VSVFQTDNLLLALNAPDCPESEEERTPDVEGTPLLEFIPGGSILPFSLSSVQTRLNAGSEERGAGCKWRCAEQGLFPSF
jgi:hypothetical protein